MRGAGATGARKRRAGVRDYGSNIRLRADQRGLLNLVQAAFRCNEKALPFGRADLQVVLLAGTLRSPDYPRIIRASCAEQFRQVQPGRCPEDQEYRVRE